MTLLVTPLGKKVKELRLAKGMTRQQLAAKGGIGHAFISLLEGGRNKYVTADNIRALAAGLDVPEDVLWATLPGGKSDKHYIPIGEG